MLSLNLALGILTGLVLGLTGAGGSIFAGPLLMWGMGWNLTEAAPVALLAVCLAASVGTVATWDVRIVRYRAAMLMAVAAIFTAPLGIAAARRLPVDTLLQAFCAVLVVVALRMLVQASRQPQDTTVVRAGLRPAICHLDANTGRIDWTPAAFALVSAIGAAAGFLAGLFGVGGGFVIVPALRAGSDLGIHSVIGTSLMAIALISGSTFLVALVQGHVASTAVALPFVGGALAGMLAGRKIAPRVAGPRLQQGFALAMLAVAAMLAAPGQLHPH